MISYFEEKKDHYFVTYNGQNSQEIWGGVPAVVLFGDDYQLWPVIEEGAIQGYSKMTTTSPLTPTNKQTAAQLLCQWGTYLFTHVMTESVFFLHQNYRVKSEEFRELLARLRVGESTTEDAQRITDLHLAYYEHDKAFMTRGQFHQHFTCSFYACRSQKRKMILMT